MTEPGFAASCTTAGKTDRVYCTVCNATLSGGETIPALAHTSVTEPGFAASCTTAGKTDRVYCAVCNTTLSGGETISVLAHTSVTEPGFAASCTTDGKTDKVYCAVCNATLSGGEIIPAAHVVTVEVGYAATCTSTGKTDRRYCRVCNVTLAGGDTIPMTEHSSAVEPGFAPTCTAIGKTDRVYCAVCNATLSGGEDIPITHATAVEQGYAATCTTTGKTDRTYCTLCGVTMSGGETISAQGHREVIDPAVAATENSPAKTQGKHCGVCGYVIVKPTFVYANDYENPTRYAGNFAYNDLAKHAGGDRMQAFYNLIDEQASEFHSSRSNAKPNGYIGDGICYTVCGITMQQALEVFEAYRLDHPLYYWISSTVLVTPTHLFLKTEQEYIAGNERAKINKQLYNKAKELLENATKGDGVYHILLSLHDQLILGADYAYEPNGTPSQASYAHNVIGVLLKGKGVCESYSESFQMLLNYCGIPNVLVTGEAGETPETRGAHEWNLVRLDDGQWYWFDLTWDDKPAFAWGISYRYFCKENAPKGFEFTHVRDEHAGGDEIGYIYELPTRATEPFDAPYLLMFDSFTLNGFTYALVGYNKVQVASIVAQGAIEIPRSVTYQGETYAVISIGAISNGDFSFGPIAYERQNGYAVPMDVTSIRIPDSVIFIWDYALEINALQTIEVAGGNRYFSAQDGVLFNKDKTVLIKYPTGKNATTYTVPNSVKWIAAGAFRNFYVNGTLMLESITLGQKTQTFCIYNQGYGYKDVGENRTTDEWDNIVNYLVGDAIIYKANGTVFKRK